MRFLTEGNPDVILAFWVGVCIFALAFVIFLTIIAMRWHVKHWERMHFRELKRWRELLEGILHGERIALPPLTAHNTSEFFEAWNDIHDAFPDSRELLQGVGNNVGLSAAAPRMLKGRSYEQGIALIALGHQGEVSDFEVIVPFLSDTSPLISLCAARALSQIDSARAVELFVPAIVQAKHWPDGVVARILKESDQESTAKALSHAILRATDDTTTKLVRFLADANAARAAPIIRQLLDSKVDDHVVSTCLQVLKDPTDVDRVRGFLAHPRWHVRMHAASALGRLGDDSDEARLLPLLSDAQWWVRYRAAQALLTLSDGKIDEIGLIEKMKNDHFSQEIIQHVMAEPLHKGAI